jgi:ABC-type branched-subunit amino acid transport system substrate-binding protein
LITDQKVGRSIVKGRSVAAVSVTLAGFALASCGDDDSGGGSSDYTLQLGDVVSLTGTESTYGPPFRKGADLAVEEVRKGLREAGLDGIKVEIEHADDQTEPQAAVSAARKLVSGGAACMAGALPSSNTIPIANAVAIPREVPLISPGSTSTEITDLDDDGLIFRTVPGDKLQGPALTQVIEDKLGKGATLSLAAQNDVFGEGIINSIADAWEARGGKVTGDPILFDPAAATYNSEASKIVAGNPDGFVVIAFPDTYAKMGAALLRAGNFDAKRLFIAGGQPSEIPEGIPPASLNGATGTRPSVAEDTGAARAFDDLFASTPGTKTRQTFEANNFDAIVLCALASVAAGSNEGEAIAEELGEVSGPPGNKYTYEELGQAFKDLDAGKDIDYEGVGGAVNFDDAGDPSIAVYDVYEYVDGKLTVMDQVDVSEE